MVDIEDAQLNGSHHQTGGIRPHSTIAIWEKLLNEFVLTFLQTLHTKGHAAEIRDLLLGIAEGKMPKKTLVILVNLIVDK